MDKKYRIAKRREKGQRFVSYGLVIRTSNYLLTDPDLRNTSQILDFYHKFISTFWTNQKCTCMWPRCRGFILYSRQRNWIWIFTIYTSNYHWVDTIYYFLSVSGLRQFTSN